MSDIVKKIEEKILATLKKEKFGGADGVIVRDLTSAICNLTQVEKIHSDIEQDNK